MTIALKGWKRELFFWIASLPFSVAGMWMLDFPAGVSLLDSEYWGVVLLIVAGRVTTKGEKAPATAMEEKR